MSSSTTTSSIANKSSDEVEIVKYWRLEEEEEGEKEGELAVLLQAGPGEGGEQPPALRKQGKRLETL
eukprot:superscaffoldBa00000607_g6026